MVDFSKYGSMVRDYVYSSYSNIFDFDIKQAYNGGDTVKVIVTFKTSYKDYYPIKLKFEIKKDSFEIAKVEKIYETFTEKMTGLSREGRFQTFFEYRKKDSPITDEETEKFITSNKDILGEGEEVIPLKIKEVLQILSERR